MKGLLIKDFKLMMVQKRFMLVIAVIVAGMALYGSQNATFLVMYMMLIGCILSVSSVTYDETDNGNLFLFSMPVSIQSYVTEKYIFCLMVSMLSWTVGLAAVLLGGLVRHTYTLTEAFMMACPFLFALPVLVAFLLPFHLLFGSEKGKIAYLIVLGGGILVAALGGKLAEGLHLDLDALTGLLEKVGSLDERVLAAGGAVLAAGVFLISCRISIGVMKKKEF